MSFRSASTPPAPATVTIFNTPLHRARAVNSTAFYGRFVPKGRLNLIAGVRWERIEGYLPAQTTPSSRFLDGSCSRVCRSTA